MKKKIRNQLLLESLPFIIMGIIIVAILLLFTSVQPSDNTRANVADPQMSAAQVIWDAIIKAGGTKQGASAVLGNWQVESSLEASAIQGNAAFNQSKAMNVSVSGYAFGLAQWDSGRRVNLISYAKSQNKDWSDPLVQVEFFLTQESDDSSLAKKIICETNISQATSDFMKEWERAGNMSSLAQRQADANYWFQAMTTLGNAVGPQGVLPIGWTLLKPIDTTNYSAATYAYKQCTWFVWNRARDFGITYGPYMGNGADWQNDIGYKVTTIPTLHSAVSFKAGQSVGGAWTASSQYGHVAFVEAIHTDGSVLISESGASAPTTYYFQVLTKDQASQYHYVIGK